MRLSAAAGLLAFASLLSGCAGPSVFRSTDHTDRAAPGSVVWFDLITPDPSASRSFYADVFGWTFSPSGQDGYEWIRLGGEPIGGLVDADRLNTPPDAAVWLCSISVADVRKAARAVNARGGRILREADNSAGLGPMAVAVDPAGAPFQLAGASSLWPSGGPRLNGWLWAELVAADLKKSTAFYRDSLGYRVVEAGRPDAVVLESGGLPRAGITASPFEEAMTLWVPFIRVEDPGAAALRAEKAGGRILLPAPDAVADARIVLLLDNRGSPFAVQAWSPEGPQ